MSEQESVEVIMKVHTASFRLMGLFSSHSNWTVWMFPLAAENKIRQQSDNEKKHTDNSSIQFGPGLNLTPPLISIRPN